MKKINSRLTKESEDSLTHPMLLIGVFAEIERNRMRSLVKEKKSGLMNAIEALRELGYDAVGRLESPVSPWLANYEVKNGLEHWTSILSKMIAHIDELEEKCYASCTAQPRDGTSLLEEERKDKLRDVGRRIKERLQDILLDYKEMIRDYVMITDGLTLATNLVLARDNVQISNETINISNTAVRDGKQMKSIALLTMIFLPATFVATLFSMSFFELGSSYMWLYPAVAVPLTIAVVAIYVCVVLLPGRLPGSRSASSLRSNRGSTQQSSLTEKTGTWNS
ncbi:hypothetical protein BKA67DRAFT_423982 [Truncatella angustata]|uniref:Uncharacterized protein n=1 Tax=Truncatella angustata TaxID=152316 RepID=A0A9P8RPM8_9PEZI|nr:uncharacterized protein BKA67DRAFT_423982 [Truncatella angustata]KAH6647020.1 hypothetical protein BKA67DRAFT_423982 [Truncatella angustata]KAH8200092.1 hypothetical protein TruAng_005760 [Truncatella angustata]